LTVLNPNQIIVVQLFTMENNLTPSKLRISSETNKQLHNISQQQLERHIKFFNKLTSLTKMDGFLPLVVKELSDRLNFEAASLVLWPRRMTTIDFWHTYHRAESENFFTQKEGFYSDISNDPLNEIKGLKEPVLLERKHWTDHFHEESSFFKEETAFRQTFYIPLLNDNDSFGVLMLRSDRTDSDIIYDEAEINAIRPLMASVISLLYRENKGYKDVSVIGKPDFKLAGARTRQQLVSTTIDSLKRIIAFNDIIITLANDGKEQLFVNSILSNHEGAQQNEMIFPIFGKAIFEELQLTKVAKVVDKHTYLSTNSQTSFFDSHPDIREVLGIALVFNKKSIGNVYLTSVKKGLLQSFDHRIVSDLSEQLALAVSNILLNEEILEKAELKSTLLDFNNELTLINNRHDLIQCLHKQINTHFKVNHSMISLTPTRSNSYFMFCDAQSKYNLQSAPGKLATHEFTLSERISQVLFSGKKSLIIDLESLIKEGENPGWVLKSHNYGLRQMTILGLERLNEYKGTLILFSDNYNGLTDEQINFASKLVSQFSFFLNNVILNEKLIEKEEKKSLLFNLTKQVATINNRTQLQAFLETEIKAILPFNGYIIHTLSKDRTKLTPLVWDTGAQNRRPNASAVRKSIPIGSDIFGKILRSENPQVWHKDSLLSYLDFSGHFVSAIEEGVEEILVSAIAANGTANGMIMLIVDFPEIVVHEKKELIKAIGNLLSIAVQNLIAAEQAFKRDEEKSFLLSFCHATATVKNQNELYSIVQKGLKDFFDINDYLLMFSGLGDDPTEFHVLNFTDGRVDKNHSRQSTKDIKFVRLDGQLVESIFDVEGHICLASNEMTETEKSFLSFGNIDMKDKSEFMCGIALRTVNQRIGIIWTFEKIYDTPLFQSVIAQISTAFANLLTNANIDRKFSEINEHKRQLEEENLYLQEEIQINNNYNEIVGSSLPMRKVFKMLSQVAESSSSVLILGETGTGKELIARAIHTNSLRNDKIMVKVNCAALPANLIESELFGHEKGSFTGAIERKIGKFELANNGTLFLDEIGELPPDLQVKILRALQEKEIERVGGRNTIKTDVRIIAATNRDLLHEVQQGNFRSDLYFRLNVFPILLPPLRDRREDIPVLAEHFLEKHAKKGAKGKMSFSSRVLKQLTAYEWPGNVRELEHLIERSILLSNSNTIEQIPLPKIEKEYAERFTSDSHVKTIDEVEREHIILVLKRCNGQVAGIGGAAQLLKIPSTTLNSKIRKLGIKKGLIAKK
jgi:formate hydrogenlyase transcriptional activator